MTPAAPHPQVAVGAVCVRDGRLLLVRRGRGAGRDAGQGGQHATGSIAASPKPGLGKWALPGGHVHYGETLADATLRELAEETGLAGTVQGLCGVAERFFGDYHYVILDYWVAVDSDEAIAGDDAADVAWAGREDLDRLDLVPLLMDFLVEHEVLGALE